MLTEADAVGVSCGDLYPLQKARVVSVFRRVLRHDTPSPGSPYGNDKKSSKKFIKKTEVTQ